MRAVISSTCSLRIVAAVIVLVALCIPVNSFGAGAADQVCDVGADYSLGTEDYPEAIRLHLQVLRNHPENALAHYHLGFAQGMLRNRAAELSEYRRAEALGLRTWDLFLNLGLAQLQAGDLNAAEVNLRQAVVLGPNHPESHFNLALAYQQRGMLAEAEREVLASLKQDRAQPDARNLLGVICAQRGETARAWSVWNALVRDAPGFAPARTNLLILSGHRAAATDETAVAAPTRQPPSKPAETMAARWRGGLQLADDD